MAAPQQSFYLFHHSFHTFSLPMLISGIKQERNPAKKQWPSDPNRITVPTEEEMANKLRVSSNYRFEHERLRCEREKSALIELQREHMTKEHEQKVRQGEIKTQILEAVLKKIQGKFEIIYSYEVLFSSFILMNTIAHFVCMLARLCTVLDSSLGISSPFIV